MNKIIAALQKLDLQNNEHWTADGLPRIDTVRMFAGNPGLSREDITKAAPDFSRQSPVLNAPLPDAPPAPVSAAPQPEPQQLDPQPEPPAPSSSSYAQPAIKQANELSEGVVGDPLERALADARELMEMARQEVVAAQEKYKEAQRVVDDLINEREAGGQGESTMTAVQSYLKSQQGLLNERARRARVLQESGVTLSDIQALIPQAAPIDEFLRRKR